MAQQPIRKTIHTPVWPSDIDEDDLNDFFEIYVHSSIGRVKLDPSANHTAVEAAFELIGKDSPADNPTNHSEYNFRIPGIGAFEVVVGLSPEEK